ARLSWRRSFRIARKHCGSKISFDPPRRLGTSVARFFFFSLRQQRHEAGGEGDVLSEAGTALRLLWVLAPTLDLEALVELCRREGGLGIDPRFDERQCQDERAQRRRREMEGGKTVRVVGLDGLYECSECRLRLRYRHDTGSNVERCSVALGRPVDM